MRRKVLILVVLAIFLISCGSKISIEASKTETLKSSVTKINIHNRQIPIKIKGIDGNEIVCLSTGKMSLNVDYKDTPKFVINQTEDTATIFLQVFSKNISTIYDRDANILIQIPKSFSGQLYINQSGFENSATISGFDGLEILNITNKDSNVFLEDVVADYCSFNIDYANVTGKNIDFKDLIVNTAEGKRTTLNFSGQPGNVSIISLNNVKTDLTYETFTNQTINMEIYSGLVTIDLPDYAKFKIEAFSTTGKVTVADEFKDRGDFSVFKKNQVVGIVEEAEGFIRLNSYLNGLVIK